jgi:hypothetical protein
MQHPHHDEKRFAVMISAFFLINAGTSKREMLEETPELLQRDNRVFSLRGGPRRPRPVGKRTWDPVAVYAPDELTEEEFLDLYEASRKHIEELNLRY